jgi:D-threo-aldose 1-dehydrogenase
MWGGRVQPTELLSLGHTGLPVSRLGVGLAPIGGLFDPVGEPQAQDTIDQAWELGLRFFDTAPLYGHGDSERRAGRGLADRAGYTISTKVGRVLDAGGADAQDFWAGVPADVTPRFDYTAAGVRRSLEESLTRLDMSRVDIVHLHDPDDHLDAAVRQGYPELVRARDEGLLSAIGAGANSAEVLAHLIERIELDVVLLAGRYTLLDRSGEWLLDLAAERGVAVVAGGVFNSGLLADPRPGARFNYLPADDELMAKALALQEVCHGYGVPLRAAAIQFVARHPAITSVLVGVRSAAEIADAAAMMALEIPDELWANI